MRIRWSKNYGEKVSRREKENFRLSLSLRIKIESRRMLLPGTAPALRLRLGQRWAARRWARAAWNQQRVLSSAAGDAPPPIRGEGRRGRKPVVRQPSVSISPLWINTQGPRITLIGTIANLGLVGMKAAAGAVSGSTAMIADAAHSLGDLLSDAVTLGALRIASSHRTRIPLWPWKV